MLKESVMEVRYSLSMGLILLALASVMAEMDGRQHLTQQEAEDIARKSAEGEISFTESRKLKDNDRFYLVYVVKGDSLSEVSVDYFTGKVRGVEVQHPGAAEKVKSKMFAMKRAEKAALQHVSGYVYKWNMKWWDERWVYRFWIETDNHQRIEIYVDVRDFQVVKTSNNKFDDMN